MNVHFDNDVIHKLAVCDLLAEAREALDVETAYVLPTAAYKFFVHRPPKGVQRYGQAVHDRIAQFIRQATPLTAEPEQAAMGLLSGVHGIDTGEAVLFASVLNLPADTLLTGDKRSLAALADETNCHAICERLAGRVMCLEQIIESIIAHFGFEHARQRIAPSTACDTALRAVFSGGVTTTESNAREGLESYIRELRGRTGALLRI